MINYGVTDIGGSLVKLVYFEPTPRPPDTPGGMYAFPCLTLMLTVLKGVAALEES